MLLQSAGAAAQAPNSRTRSLELFKQSAGHYKEGRYAVAAELLEEAYALFPEPKLLYNLGRARAAAGEVEAAIEAYEGFISADPDTPRREQVEAAVEELRAQIPEPEPTPTPVEEVPAPTDVEPAPSPLDPPKSWARTKRKPIGWSLIGVGGASLVAGLAVGLNARSLQKDADAEPVQSEAADLQSRAERNAVTSNVMVAVGVAFTLTGGGWLYFARSDAEDGSAGRASKRHWALRLRPNGLDCALSFR